MTYPKRPPPWDDEASLLALLDWTDCMLETCPGAKLYFNGKELKPVDDSFIEINTPLPPKPSPKEKCPKPT